MAHGVFKRRDAHPDTVEHAEKRSSRQERELPQYNDQGQQVNHNGHVIKRGICPDGESGRSWFNPWHFLRISWRSSCTASRYTNVLWPFTIAAMVLHFGYREHDLWIFITAYIGMVPAANLVGFAGQELARKLPKVAGVILETTFGSIVEIILFMVLISGGNKNVAVIRAAILGSILANLLFCLGSSCIESPLATLCDLPKLTCAQASASSWEVFSTRSRHSTRPSAKWVVILCSSRQVRNIIATNAFTTVCTFSDNPQLAS